MKSKISICIPTYEMRGLGVLYLKHNFEIFRKQTFRDFEVIISDHSKDDSIRNLCEEYSTHLQILYIRNETNHGNSSANINNAMRHAQGHIIKILFQDDFLYDEKSLEDIDKNFNTEKYGWFLTGCEHTKNGIEFIRPFFPRYFNGIHRGKNTISSPSVLSIKNEKIIFFDENLIWLMDVDYYKRCYNAFGKPQIINTIGIVNRLSPNQLSNTLSIQRKESEYLYIIKKHEKKIWYQFFRITRFFRYLKYIWKKKQK